MPFRDFFFATRHPESPAAETTAAQVTFDRIEQTRAQVFNALQLSVAFFLIGYSAVYWHFQLNKAFWIDLCGALFCAPLTYFVNKKSPLIARTFFVIWCNGISFWISATFSHQVGTELYFLPSLFGPFIVFGPDRRKELAAGILLPIALFITVIFEKTKLQALGPLPFFPAEDFLFQLSSIGAILFASGIAGVYAFILGRSSQIVKDQLSIEANNLIAFGDASISVLFMLDLEGRFLYANSQLAENTGHRKADILGKTVFELFPTGPATKMAENYQRVIQTRIPLLLEEPLPSKKGVRWHLTCLFPICDRMGNVVRVGGQVTDTTDQKQILEDLIEAQSTARIGSWKFNLKTHELKWSTEHYKIFEIPEPQAQETLYKLYRERIHPEDVAALDQVVERATEAGEDFVYDHRVSLEGGSRIKFVRGIGKVQRDEKGRPIQIKGTCQDVTEKHQLEQSLEWERIKSMHQSKLASLGEISAGIAHEINNPLAVILATTHLLTKFQADPVKLSEKSEVICRAAERIEKIVNGLKKFSYRKTTSDRKLQSLGTMTAEALSLTEIRSRHYECPVIFCCETESKIACDEVEIEQVIVNLVNNALDATQNDKNRWVRLHLFDDKNEVVLQVKDSGSGIPEQVRSKLFEPFFTTKPVGKGTGLGLSISKGILEDHGASIAILNDANTCFEIRFPKVQPV